MARQTFTDRTLKVLKPAEAGKRYEMFDAIIPNMGVRVTDKGKRSFFLLARFPPSTNPTRRVLGEYPALELAAARDKAREWLAMLDRGIDPKQHLEAEKKARKVEETEKQDRAFETVLARFIKVRRRDGLRRVQDDEWDFNRDCLPKWRGKAVDEITMADILDVVEGIRDRGAERQALNMAQKIGTFLNWCADEELILASPYRPKRIASAIGKKKSRSRKLTDDEIRAFWKAAHQLNPTERDIYKLLLLTGQRLNDIARMSWSEVDAAKAKLTIPAERFKSERDHALPLTPQVLEILAGVKRWKNCPWVFSLQGETPIAMGGKAKKRLDAAMLSAYRELKNDKKAKIDPWINHDIRRTVRTRLSELDIMDEVAEAVIGHVPSKLNRTYNHSERLRVKLDALTRWEAALAALIEGKDMDNVINLDAHREMA